MSSEEKLKGAPSAKPRAILSAEKAVEIFRRSLLCDGSFNATSVARDYGISEKAVRDIWKARTWSDETRHLDPQRPPRELKLPGRPLGKRDSVPRRRKRREFPVRMEIDGLIKSSVAGHTPLRKITGADFGVSPALQCSGPEGLSLDSQRNLKTEHIDADSGGIDDSQDLDFQPFTISASSSQQNVPWTDPPSIAKDISAPIEIGHYSCALEDLAELAQVRNSSVRESKSIAGALSGMVCECSWGPLVPTSWEPRNGNGKHTVLSTTSLSATETAAPPAGLGANAKTGCSGGSSGGDGRNALDEGAARARCGLAGLAGASGEPNSRKHGASVVHSWSEDLSEEDGGDGAGSWSRASMDCFDAPVNAADQASREPILAFRGHFAPDSRHCRERNVQTVPSESARRSDECQWAYGFHSPHAVNACGGWAMDYGPSWAGSCAAGQFEDLPSSHARTTSPPVAAASVRAGVADTAGTDWAGQQQAPLQRCLREATPSGGDSQSTWRLERKDWNPVFEPPLWRSAAEEARGRHRAPRQRGEREVMQDPAPLQHQQHQLRGPGHHHYQQYSQHEQHSHQHSHQSSREQHRHQPHHLHHQDLRSHFQREQRQQQQQPDPHHRYSPVQQDQQEPRRYPLQQYAMQQEPHHDQHFEYQHVLYDPFLPRCRQLQQPHQQPNPEDDWQARQQDRGSSSLRMHGWG